MFAEVLRPLSATTTTRSPQGRSRTPALDMAGSSVVMSLRLLGKSS